MWEKWAILATNAGITCLMRASLGDIIGALGGSDVPMELFGECRAVAASSGFPLRPPIIELLKGLYTSRSQFKTSMLRDIERGNQTEGEHVLGDMVTRAQSLGIKTPILVLCRGHVAAYEAIRLREPTMSARNSLVT
jgi:2-dehydropantoate 2-reductase